MPDKQNIKWVYGIAALFVILNSYLIAKESFYLMILPAALFIGLFYIQSMDKVLLFITFCVPLSINYEFKDGGLSLSLPTEPLMMLVLLVFFMKFLVEGGLEKKILTHPITIAITLNLIWILFTCFTSTLPMVSFKFLLARLWFVIPFYFLGVVLFKQFSNISRFQWLYIIPMAGVSAYTIIQHAQFGFDEESAHWVMTPFFNDHTSYGAMLAMFYPVLLGFIINKDTNQGLRFISFLFFVFFTLAIVLSYTRAAWVSLVVGMVLFFLIKLKVKFKTLLSIAGIIFVVVTLNAERLLMKLEKNRQDSSDNLTEHVQSISNISSDASNLERLNRWSSAMRMFNEKPLLGFGPGTYMFKYAPFQKASEKTIISTNAGDAGNAHSEYIGPLAESGIFGLLSMLAILITASFTSFRLYLSLPRGQVRTFLAGTYIGLVTYFIHGALNNFLDTDKAAVPFWGFLAIITAIDLYHQNKLEKENNSLENPATE